MNIPPSLSRDISPPTRLLKRRKISFRTSPKLKQDDAPAPPSLAAVEAGRARVENHLAYFAEHLSKSCRAREESEPRIDIDEWADLYAQNEHEHDDLRLQFSKTSSISFALPKGLPGNPNSKSLGRMAIETRVHNRWNHLIESASRRTGSLLIWDTGTYTILPRKKDTSPPSQQTTDNESESGSEINPRPLSTAETLHENEKLVRAFRTKYIRLRLNGTRLPKNYTVTLRLPSANDFGKPQANFSIRKRRRKSRQSQPVQAQSTDSEQDAEPQQIEEADEDIDTDVEEDNQTRMTNSYPGSTNSIGSVHQRRWFMMLDRASSGFVQKKGAKMWVRRGSRDGEDFEPFLVRGRDLERSVLTGRLAKEVESDEGVEGFVGRSGWVGITT